MNWHESDGIWQQGVRAWRQLLLVLVGSLVLTMLFPIAVLWYLAGPLHTLSVWSIVFIGIATALLLAAAALALRWWLRTTALLKLVPKHAGRVCPKCSVPVVLNEANESNGPSDQLTCQRCAASYTERELQSYWRRYGVSPMERSRWMMDEKFIEDGAIQSAIRVRTMRRSTIQMTLMMGLIWTAVAAFNVLTSSSPFTSGQNWLPLVMLGVAAILAGYGWRAVDAERRFCTACRYERAEGAGDICPECGSEWNEPGATTAGRIVPRPGPLIVAGLVIAIWLAATISIFTGSNLIARAIPTNTVINAVANATDADGWSLYRQLSTRNLTERQHRRLIELVLEKRDRNAMSAADGQWLGGQHVNGAIPPDLLEEFHRGAIHIELDSPPRANVGEEIEVLIRTVDRFSITNAQFPSVIVGGFYIDDDPTPHHRQSIAKGISLLGEGGPIMGLPIVNRGQGPRLTFTRDRPGPVRVRLELWLFAMQQAQDTSFIVQWKEDGTPVPPPRYDWMERIVIERVIEVSEDR